MDEGAPNNKGYGNAEEEGEPHVPHIDHGIIREAMVIRILTKERG